MECDLFEREKLLEAYEELSSPPSGFRDHIESCPGCRADLEDLRDISERYRTASVERLPSPPAPRRRMEWWMPLGAAALFLLTVSSFVLRGGEDGTKTVRQARVARPLLAWDYDESALDAELGRIRRRVEELEQEYGRSR